MDNKSETFERYQMDVYFYAITNDIDEKLAKIVQTLHLFNLMDVK